MTGTTKAWLGRFGEVGHPYSHPSEKQCSYTYTHPNEKQCNYSVDTSGFATTTQLNEVKISVSSGKSTIAAAVTDKGVQTAADATFATIATNIRNIPQPKVNDWDPYVMEEDVMLDLSEYSYVAAIGYNNGRSVDAGTYIVTTLFGNVNLTSAVINIYGTVCISVTPTMNIVKVTLPKYGEISTPTNNVTCYIWKKN